MSACDGRIKPLNYATVHSRRNSFRRKGYDNGTGVQAFGGPLVKGENVRVSYHWLW